MTWPRRFGVFWYDFIVGDDWRVGAGVVIVLAVVALLADASVPTWWLLPLGVAGVLARSLWRASGGSARSRRRW